MTINQRFVLILTAALPLVGCTVNLGNDAGTDGTGDTSGDGDGDGDPTGDGDGDTQSCPEGTLDCPCYGNDSCDAGLECDAGICVPAAGDGDGDGEPGDGDGDGEPGDGDGDGDSGDGDGDNDLCGNGDIDLGEDCDDANAENGDGCNNDCTDSGALLWQETFPVFQDDDYAMGVAVDSSDRIFVTGFGRVVNNNIDGWYRKYSADGQLYWDETFGGPETEGAYRVAVNPDDEILIAGWLHNGANTDAMLRKIDQNGAEIWTRTFEVLADDTAFGVAVAEDGTFVVSGGSAGSTGWLRRYDADGQEIWTETFMDVGPRGREVGYTADGNIAVVIDNGRHARLYTTAGNEVWTYAQNNICESIALAIDDNDVLLAGCETVNPNNAWFGRLDADGNLLWDETWAGDGNTYAHANDIEVDSAGRIIVVGARRVLDQTILVSTRKYSPDGQELIWEQTLQGSKAGGSNAAAGVTIDSQNNVIVVGNVEQDADSDAFVAKYGP